MHFLITTGATREYIDPVRFISNASSGKMGFALAGAALKVGHKVTLITASTAQQPPCRAKIVKAESAAQMLEAVKKHFKNSDCLIMAAAVSDYTPIKAAKTKMKKTGKSITIKLKPTTDILQWAGRHKKKNQIVVGFALEDKTLRTNAERKLKEKNLDMIIANTPAAIGAEEAMVQIKRPQTKWLSLLQTDKAKVAKKIIALIEDITQHFCQD